MNPSLDRESLAAWPAALALLARAGTDAQREWAAHTALRVARDLAAGGARVLLIDTEGGRARLARLLGVPSGPGIAEVLDGEASVPSVAHRPPGEAFYFIGLGERRFDSVADAPGWAEIARRMKEAGARLLVYARAEDWPEPEGIPGIEGVVVLDGPGDGFAPARAKLLAQLVAPSGLRRAPPPGVRPLPKARLLATPRERRRVPAAGVVLFLAALVAVTWLLVRPGSSGPGEGEDVGSLAAAGVPPAIDRAAARRVPYSVQVESYSALADALRRARQLADLLRVPVFVAPAAIDSILYYRVFAGMEADADSAQGLLRRLVARGVKDSARAWDVRALAWAFDLGVFPDRVSAERRRAELLEIGVPGYLVEVPTTAGLKYRLYAGGYENAADAQVLAAALERNGIRASLVERVGSAR